MNQNFMAYIIKSTAWIPAILIAVFIFGFSGQSGEQSSGLSQKVAKKVVEFAGRLNVIELTAENEPGYLETVETLVRKAAHMAEYMIFALSLYFGLFVWGVRLGFRFTFAFLMAFCFACTDEIHQLFIDGRNGSVWDVLIDSIGIGIGLGIMWVKNKKQFAGMKINK